MDRRLIAFSVAAGLLTAIAVAPAQNYPTREPDDLLHGGPIENGVKHQPTQAEIDERLAHDRNAKGSSPGAVDNGEVDRLYSQIKQQSVNTTILTPENTPSPITPPPVPPTH